MSWTLVISGLAGAAMLALGSGFVWPMGTALGGICDLVGSRLDCRILRTGRKRIARGLPMAACRTSVSGDGNVE